MKICLVLDVIDLYNMKKSGVITLMDFDKSFYIHNWKLVFNCLTFFRFNQSFITMKTGHNSSAIFSRKRITQSNYPSQVCSNQVLYSAESTDAMQIKCVALGRKILMQPRIEPSISISRNRLLNLANIVLHY